MDISLQLGVCSPMGAEFIIPALLDLFVQNGWINLYLFKQCNKLCLSTKAYLTSS